MTRKRWAGGLGAVAVAAALSAGIGAGSGTGMGTAASGAPSPGGGQSAVVAAARTAAQAPGKVGNLRVINQGGVNNGQTNKSYVFNGNKFMYNNGTSANYQALSWTPATAGENRISGYRIYRNGKLYDTITKPVTIKGYISGSTLTVKTVRGGKTAIADGKLMSGVQLQSTAPGFVAGTVLNHRSDGKTGGGAGRYAVNFSQRVGSAAKPVTFTAWAYQDTRATGVTSPDFSAPETTYRYAVAAVDTAGAEGPRSTPAAYLFQGIAYNGGTNFDYSGASSVWNDTSGKPANGPYDIAVTWPGQGGFLPTFGSPAYGTLAPNQRFDIGEFKYLVFDLKAPTGDTNYRTQSLFLNAILRAYGTVSGTADADTWNSVNIFDYAKPTPGKWVHVQIPLAALGLCDTTVTGTFTATGKYTGTLTVTKRQSPAAGCVGIPGSAYITGAGIPANTYVSGYSGTQPGGAGTYTLTGPGIRAGEKTPAETVVSHGTQLYKMGFQWSGAARTTYYLNNLGFTTS